MAQRKWTGSIFATVIVLTSGLLLSEARDAEAQRGRGRRAVFIGGFYGPAFGVGFGPWGALGPWGEPWGGPWSGHWAGYRPADRLDTLAVAKMTGWGALELHVKPNRADVWVDGEYVGEARDLDGSPSYLWLEKGPHRLAIYKGGYQTFTEEVNVERGVMKALKLRLEPGNSAPPGPKPSDPKGQEQKDQRREDKQTE